MADDKIAGAVGITRILEYYGPEEWIRKTLDASQVPAQGTKEFRDDNGKLIATIRSAIAMWVPLGSEAGAAADATAEGANNPAESTGEVQKEQGADAGKRFPPKPTGRIQ